MGDSSITKSNSGLITCFLEDFSLRRPFGYRFRNLRSSSQQGCASRRYIQGWSVKVDVPCVWKLCVGELAACGRHDYSKQLKQTRKNSLHARKAEVYCSLPLELQSWLQASNSAECVANVTFRVQGLLLSCVAPVYASTLQVLYCSCISYMQQCWRGNNPANNS